jgi:23S rRNA pseudouridine1911/1915/1917 synthase
MQYIGFPLIGDQTYGLKVCKKNENIRLFTRQALHAESLSFTHPITNKNINIQSELPDDLINLENILNSEQ